MNTLRPNSQAFSRSRGMTLLEMTVVILVLLSLIGILFMASRAWKAGSDRAGCILHLESVQKGVRGYSNMYQYAPGTSVSGLKDKIIGTGCFVANEPNCPGGGDYTFGAEYGEDTIPPFGSLYMTCSLAASHSHEPDDYSGW